MTLNKGQSIEKLIRTFIQFDKLDWERKTIQGYKPSEIRVLTCIKEKTQNSPKIKVSEISKQLDVTMPTVTPILNKLEQDNLITRKIGTNDRRVVLVALTSEGKSVADRALAKLHHTFTLLEEYIGIDDSIELTRIMTKVNEFFNDNKF
jgi:DNA-binding MarR family transcriptional regulator